MTDQVELQRIYDQIERSTSKIEGLAEVVAELTKVIAAKEVNDTHMQKALDTLTTDVKKLSEEVSKLKLVSAGDAPIRKLIWTGVTVVIVAVLTAVVGLVIVK